MKYRSPLDENDNLVQQFSITDYGRICWTSIFPASGNSEMIRIDSFIPAALAVAESRYCSSVINKLEAMSPG